MASRHGPKIKRANEWYDRSLDSMAPAKVPLICLVEDDPSIRTALMSLLRSAGLHVEAFASAEAFLDHAARERVSCLICDVYLPGMSGLALQHTLVERQVPIPIIFHTGCDDPALARQAQDAGAVAWLTKPVREHDLLHAIMVSLNRTTNSYVRLRP